VADPAGSVSIVDVSRGVENADVAQAGFEGFDARIEEYRNAGVRIPHLGESFFEAGEGEVRLSTDLEPEYIAVASDGKTAWVSLQENDAVAVLDIAARRFTQILPLGVKDFSRGQPSLASVALPPPEPLRAGASESPAPKAPVLGGLWFEPGADDAGARAFYLLRGGSIERRELGQHASTAAAASTTAIGDAHVWRGQAQAKSKPARKIAVTRADHIGCAAGAHDE